MQHRLSKEEKVMVCERYSAGEATTTLSDFFKISPVAICGILKRRNIDRRPQHICQKSCSLNDAAFDVFTPEASYWIGFLFADGTIIERAGSPELALVLSERDRKHVEKFREFLGSSHKILTVNLQKYTDSFNSQNAVRLCVRSTGLACALKHTGLIKHLGSIAIPELATSRHFWRGVVDGDGYIGTLSGDRSPHARLELVGGLPLLSQFAEYIHHQIPTCKITVRPHKSIFSVGLTCSNALKMINILYSDAPIALARKLNAALNILSAGTRLSGVNVEVVNSCVA